MPSGWTHGVITSVAAAGLYYGLTQAGYPSQIVYAAAGGCMAGVLITPDLDVDNATRSHYIVLRRTGWIGFLVWRAIWLPYGLAIGHRSWVSHMPVISTLIRLLYLVMILALVSIGANALGHPFAWRDWIVDNLLVRVGVGGLMISDTLHWLADIISTGIKRRLHKRRPGRQKQYEGGHI